MNKREKVRRSCLLCLSFARNYALYNAAYRDDGSLIVGGTPNLANQFWNIVHGNNIDVAVMEWCKLFGKQTRDKHHWRNVIKDQARYKIQLLTMFGGSNAIWEAYWTDIIKYRDKFVAHLDEDNQFIIPYLHKAHELVESHYNYLLEHETADGFFDIPPPDIHSYYQQHLDMARAVYLEHQ